MSCPNEEHYSLLSKSSSPDPKLSKDKDYLRIFVHKDNLKSTDYWKNLELSCVYLGNLPLSENKKKDIMDLVKKNIIPKKYYESYYKNIIGN